MSDVARAAKVHQTTVSLALRNDPRLPIATRRRIQEIANGLGYRPNPLVSALISGRKRGRTSRRGSVIAFLTAYPSASRWRESVNYASVYAAMERSAEGLGYRLEEFWLREPGMTASRLKKILLARGIRGIIVCPLPGDAQEIDFDFSDFSAVALGFTLKRPQLDHVAIDYSSIMGMAIQRLAKSGHRRIGFATTDNIDERVDHLSLGRFLAEKHRIPRYFRSPLLSEQWDKKSLLRWMEKEKADAIITAISSDYLLFRKWLEEAGYRIPRDLSLVNVDCRVDSQEAGVVQNLEEEARAAVELVTGRVERARFGLPEEPQTILIKGRWREGDSLQDRG